MGVVYKAEDTKLERTVALKFLAAHLLNDDEAKQRFLREAKAAAALHHANICPVYEIDEADGRTFISMAFVDGETLEDRIAQGPLPIKDALEIGQQIAKGLEAAHEKGIIHRDVKPANALVAQDGQVTIMDFGLARLTEASRLTKAEQTVGTAAYMSPEQIQGGEVDHRTDVWALGCVLYEMIAGVRPFKGQYDQALLYEIVNQEPEPLTGVRAGVPMELEFIVGKCLAKAAGDRYQHASEIAVDLRTLAEKLKSGRSTILSAAQLSAALPVSRTATAAATGVRRSPWVLQALVALLGIALIAVSYAYWTVPEAEKAVRRFSFSPAGVTGAWISPNGKYILYATEIGGRRSLWLRSLASEAARELPGTAGARDAFWSPDSLTIGVATATELKRVSLDGGDPITLCGLAPGLYPSEDNFKGGTWSPDGQRIIFSSGFLLYEIPARGGEPELLFEGGGDARRIVFGPHFLPQDNSPGALVYTASREASDSLVMLLDLETGRRQELGPGLHPVYSTEDGHLIYGSDDDDGLLALPFSLDKLSASGRAFPISEVGREGSVSRDGSLVYLDRDRVVGILAWRSRAGEMLETIGKPQPRMRNPSLSPDGRWAAAAATESGNQAVWIHDLVRSTTARLTLDPGGQMLPTWSPLGSQVVYRSSGDGPNALMRKPRDGSGEAVVLAEAETDISNPDWSRDGRYLAYQEENADGDYDIAYRRLDANGDTSGPTVYMREPAHQRVPEISPDGRFLAYCSDESGRLEVYVRPFPEGAGKWQVSVGGGTQPRWRSDGKELYYVQDTALIVVSVSTDQGFTLGQPKELFGSSDLFSRAAASMYDVSADGQRFLTITPAQAEDSTGSSIHFVENWHEEFRDRERD